MSINQTRATRTASRPSTGEAIPRGTRAVSPELELRGQEAGTIEKFSKGLGSQASGNVSPLKASPPPPEEAPEPLPSLNATAATEDDGVTDANGAPTLPVPAEISPSDIGLWLAVLADKSTQESGDAQQVAITARAQIAKALGEENVKRIRDASAKAVEAEHARRHRSFWGTIRHVVDLMPVHIVVALVKSGGDPKAMAAVGMAALKALNDVCSLVQLPNIEPSAWMAEALTPMFKEMGMSKKQAEAWGKIAASALENFYCPGMIAVDPNVVGQMVGASMELDGYDQKKIDEVTLWTNMAVGLATAVGSMGYAAYSGVRFASELEQLATAVQRIDQTYEGVSQMSKGLTDMEVAAVNRTFEEYKAQAVRVSARFKENSRQEQEQSDFLSEINQRMEDIDKIATELLNEECRSLDQIISNTVPASA